LKPSQEDFVLNNGDGLIGNIISSTKKVGTLYPILEDYYGNIIDGQHRIKANNEWPRMRLKQIKTEKDMIIARLISNTCRRSISAKEKTNMLSLLGEILLKEGILPGELSKKITEEIGMSYEWVLKYLPEKYKDSMQSMRASSAVYCKAGMTKILRLSEPPKEKLIEIGNYTNSNFVLLTIRKPLFEKIKKISDLLCIKPDILLQNAIEDKFSEIAQLTNKYIEKR
jgi:hypothetical protein